MKSVLFILSIMTLLVGCEPETPSRPTEHQSKTQRPATETGKPDRAGSISHPAVLSLNAEISSERFDLVCEGMTTGSNTGPFRKTIHVDLVEGAYCIDDCTGVGRIHARSGGLITFSDKPSDGYYLVNRASWSPATGYQAEFAATFRVYYETRTVATCLQSPFSAGSKQGLKLEPGQDDLLSFR